MRESPALISRAAQPTFGRVLARMKASAPCSDDGETDRLRCNSYLL
jgi:hypothetical protein